MRESKAEDCGAQSDFATDIVVAPEVREFMAAKGCDFRVCTSCGGPIILPISVKRPKKSDIKIPVGEHTLFVSSFQAPFLSVIDGHMLPRFNFQ
ncbi:MAG: hypothetical protein QHG99_08520 [Methanomicrobiales archaeon]|nr:hypothetical protein [Methanomicrobiales archaeon]